MARRPRRNERGLVMPPGPRSIPRSGDARPRKRSAAPDPPDLEPIVMKAAGDLMTLVRAITDCDRCVPSGSRYALGAGYPRAPVMLVGERPSAADLESKVVFTDEAPAIEKAFDTLGMSLAWVYGTTATRTAEAAVCADHLSEEIEAVDPRVIVAFGARTVDALRALDGRCGIRVPDEVPQGTPVALRPGLVLVATEPLPAGVQQTDAKRRLWRDLRQLPALLSVDGAGG